MADEVSYATPEKEAAFRKSVNATVWFAACETNHFFWAGPDRNRETDAEADAQAHDARKHGGEETAVVLSS